MRNAAWIFSIIFLLIVGAAAFNLNMAAGNSDDDPPGDPYPIHIPNYEGVDQFLLLSNKYGIVVTTNIEDVLDQVNKLTNGEFNMYVQSWVNSQETGHLDWYSWHKWNDMYDHYAAEARLKAGELALDAADYYSIGSDNDPNYRKPLQPLRVTRYLPSLGKGKLPGEYEIRYAHYSYLEFPKPLANEKTYTITLKNGKKVTFLYDEKRTISRAIKVNQVGYLPDAEHKYAYLGCYLQELGPMDCSQAKDFYVISAETGQAVYQGQVALRAANPRIAPKPRTDENPNTKPLMTGEDTYELDITPVKQEGTYFISIPGVGRSWPFKIGRDAYGEAFYIATRGLYHQRCGIALGEPYTAWPRIKCHTGPVYESQAIPFCPGMDKPNNYDNFDVIGKTIDMKKKNDNATGGWHDAADWDKNILHYLDVFDLLYAYELSPNLFRDGQLNIPESGNGIPDILCEAEYGLSVWKKSLDSRFGAAGLVETFSHPTIDDPEFPYAYSLRTRWATLLFSAAAAQYSHLVKPFNASLSNTYKELAEKAFDFGANQKNSLGKISIQAAEDRGKGKPYTIEWTEKDSYDVPYEIQARLRVYILTGEKKYLEPVGAMLDKAPLPDAWPFSLRDVSTWLYYSIFNDKVTSQLPLSVVERIRKQYLELADEMLVMAIDEPYRRSWPVYQDYWMSWGAMTMTNQARVLLLAYKLTGDKSYREAALLNVDYMLGTNPMGMSWTTGLGYTYPIEIQHFVSENDGIPDPVPGLTIYGVTEAMFRQLTTTVWETKKPDGTLVQFMNKKNKDVPAFRCWSCHPTLNTPQCEFTIHETMSSTIFCTAMLIPEGWMPSEQLKQKKPTEPSRLFGYWYLP